VFYAGKMVERRGGSVVRDLTTTERKRATCTWWHPCRPAWRAAIKPTGQLPTGVMAKTEPPVDKSVPTPWLGGHPNLRATGVVSDWIGNYMDGCGAACAPTAECGLRSARRTRRIDFELYSPCGSAT